MPSDLAGTDTPPGVYIFPGFSLHEELQRFVAAGFTPLEALQTATLLPRQIRVLRTPLYSALVSFRMGMRDAGHRLQAAMGIECNRSPVLGPWALSPSAQL